LPPNEIGPKAGNCLRLWRCAAPAERDGVGSRGGPRAAAGLELLDPGCDR